MILAASTIDDRLGEKIAARGQAVAERLAAFDGLSQVACHGDCHGFNTLMVTDAEGRRRGAFFDFDDGGPGPLAYDLGVYLWNILQRLGAKPFEDQHRGVWTAFLDGYRRMRPISQADLDAIPAHVQARELWFLGEYAAHAPQWGSESFAVPWVRARLAALKAWSQARPFAD
jgi:Ser/Thr protein kinase RdoA (MazF antagonist)